MCGLGPASTSSTPSTHEIAAEEAREADATAGRLHPDQYPPHVRHRPTPTRPQPSSRQVKEWALTHGLITTMPPGRPARALIDAYNDAHQNGATT